MNKIAAVFALLVTWDGFGGRVALGPVVAQNQDLDRIGGEGNIYIPETLDQAVGMFPAAVVARIKGFGSLTTRERLSPGGVRLGLEGLSTYHVSVETVLYNRLGSGAPALAPGSALVLSQVVARDEAKQFVAGRTRVSRGDECLLFLWYRRGDTQWSMEAWPFQFRRAIHAPETAEAILSSANLRWLQNSNVAVDRTDSRSTVAWSTLLDQVKRAGESTSGK